MNDLLIPALGIFALGITTTLHPCPLATNISAISLISGISSGKKRHIGAILSFSAGYIIAFVLLAIIINFGLLSIPRLSLILQRIVLSFFGPLLILTGMIQTKLINLDQFYRSISISKNYWITNGSFFSSLILGFLLALTFCPATASIFFGLMIPLSVKHDQSILFPVIYAAGALFPIMTISILIYRGLIQRLSNRWTKQFPKIAGWIIILLGVYITLDQLYF